MASRNSIASALLGAGKKGGPSIAALSPLAQSNSQGFDINRPYGNNLAREHDTFHSGAMGPLAPIMPTGLDEPDPVSGRPPQRRFQYPVGWNMNMGQPGSEGLKLASFATLRQFADTYSIARICIERRVAEVCGLKWDIVPTQEAELKMHGDESLRTDWEERKAKIVKFFKTPDSDRAKYPTFDSWLAALLEDVCVIDAVAVHVRSTRSPRGGLFGSGVASLDLIDGSTIRPMLDIHGATPQPPNVAYQQYLWGVPRSDMLSMIEQDDIESDAVPRQEFRQDQLMYLRYRPRNWTPYGLSMCEQALMPIAIGLARQQWQWDYYQEGSIPGQFVTAGPDISTPQQVRQLQDALNAMAGDVGQKHKIVVLPPGSATKDQKQINLADQSDPWITACVTMAFGLNNLDLGIIPQITSSISSVEIREMPGADTDPAMMKRLTPLVEWLKAVLFDKVIQELFKQDDMQWSWGLAQEGTDKSNEIEQHIEQIKYGMESVDEGRIAVGRAPWGLPETSTPMAWTATGPIPLATLTSETGETDVRPWSSPTGRKPTDAELNSPSHAGAGGQGKADPAKIPAQQAAGQAKPAAPAPKPPAFEAKPAPPSAKKSFEVEMGVLGRYLRKGRDLAKFVPTVTSQEALEAGLGLENPEEAILAIRKVMEPVLEESNS